MRKEPVELYLEKLEEYRVRDNLSRVNMANELGIPYRTYENWYRAKRQVIPLPRYIEWLKGFLEEREVISARRWIGKEGPALLKKIGFKKGQTAVDFGSGRGDYSLILASVVGEKGKVHPVDKDRKMLGVLMGRVRGRGFKNVEEKFVSRQTTPTEIPLKDKSVDAIWASDVVHDGYFKKDEKKKKLLKDVRRVLKPGGFISIHPVHMQEQRLKKIIESMGFYLEKEYQEIVLFHGTEFHRGSILKYKKKKEVLER